MFFLLNFVILNLARYVRSVRCLLLRVALSLSARYDLTLQYLLLKVRISSLLRIGWKLHLYRLIRFVNSAREITRF